jgi:16S rRNA (guanine1207-N2)-methyltransferase
MQTETTLAIADQTLSLQRYPRRRNELLRAWDAADEYLLMQVSESIAAPPRAILVANDAFGALSIGLRRMPMLAGCPLTVLSDSVISRRAMALNASDNQVAIDSVALRSSSELAKSPAPLLPSCDRALIKIPKSLAQLEDNLRLIRPLLSDGAQVIGAGMTKNVHNSTLSLFEQHIGVTSSSRARKKARLIFATAETQTASPAAASREHVEVSADLTKTGRPLVLSSCPGVFSHASLDYGTQFMLQTMQVPQPGDSSRGLDILDLGCGTGALGLIAAQRLEQSAPGTPINALFVDESLAAIASVNDTLQRLESPREHQYQTLATHCLEGIDDASQDLILNNPPFHDAGARTLSIALEMFRESKRVLRKGGELQVVANRHLGYLPRLRELFHRCDVLGENSKFVVLRAIK